MAFRSLRFRLSTITGIAVFLIMGILVVISAVENRNEVAAFTESIVVKYAEEIATHVISQLDHAMDSAYDLAIILTAEHNGNRVLTRDEANETLKAILEEHPSFLAVYTLWESNQYDGNDSLWQNTNGHDATGRFIPYLTMNAYGKYIVEPLVDYETEGEGDYYQIPKQTCEPAIVGPYEYPVLGRQVEILSFVVPIMEENKFMGIAGVDITVEQLQNWVEQINMFEGRTVVTIINGDFLYVAHSEDPLKIGTSALVDHDDLEQFVNSKIDRTYGYDHGWLHCHERFSLGGTDDSWIVSVEIPKELVFAGATTAMWKDILISGIFLIALLLLLFLFIGRNLRNLTLITGVIENASKGDIPDKVVAGHGNDEIGLLGQSVEKMRNYLNDLVEVTRKVAQGDFSEKPELKSENDMLGIAVGNMVDHLAGFSENLRRRVEYLNNIPAPVLVVNKDFNLQYVNIAAAEIIGKDLEDCIGRKCYDLFRSGDCRTVNCACAKAMSDATTFTRETIFHANDLQLPIRYTGTPLYDSDGNVSGAIEHILDISDEFNIASMAGIIASGNYEVRLDPRSDSDELVIALNSMAEILGNLRDENKRSSWIKNGQIELENAIREKHDLDAILGSIITCLAEHTGAGIGAFYLTDSSDGALHLRAGYAYDRQRSIPAVYSPGDGLVGQCALEKKPLLLSDVPDDYIKISSGLGEATPDHIYFYPVLFEEVLIGVIELGVLGQFEDAKQAYIEKACETVGVAVNLARIRMKQQELLEETQSQSEELQTQQEEMRQTNEELEEQSQALEESREKLQNQQEELRQTNEELEERTEELEKRSEEITRKNTELEDSRQMLKDKAEQLEISGKYKSEFLANMSHELRTPLNSMLILSELLKKNEKGNLSEKQVEFASTVHDSGVSLLNLINEILDLSKIEAGKIEFVFEDVSLTFVLNEVKRYFEPVSREKSLEFIISRSDDLPEAITTDEQRLGQILRNLLSNAFKFTEKGSVKLEVRKLPQSHMLWDGSVIKNAISCDVTDSGCGIPEKKMKAVFEAFQQADGTTSRKYGGTGLGLSISRELARNLGGEIKVSSIEGKGSTFSLIIPADGPSLNEVKAQEPPGRPASEPEEKAVVHEPPEPAETEGAGKTEEPEAGSGRSFVKDDRKEITPDDRVVLVIEDNPDFAGILYNIAHEKGYRCLVADDGEMGLQLSDLHRPDAIMLDIGLPGIGGMTVLARLKENLETRHIPVHVLSGFDKEREVLRCGALSFLKKPIGMGQIDDLFEKINLLSSNPVRKLLVVENDKATLKSVKELIEEKDVEVTGAAKGRTGLNKLISGHYDCIVLDYSLPDMSALEFLEEMKGNEVIPYIPVIIYTDRNLTEDERKDLDRYAERIILKDVNSKDRLLDETALFLHRIEKDLPEKKRKVIAKLHDREAIFRNKNILVVDDDMRNVFALSSVLEDRGMILTHAKNGRESLEKLDAQPDTDLVLMDIMMPEMDGYEAMRRIRKQQRFAGLPVIALTAKAMKGDRAKCIEAGANDYLSKPVDLDRLLSMMRVWLYR